LAFCRARSTPRRSRLGVRQQHPYDRGYAALRTPGALAKELGGTHVSITEDLPPALWEFNPPVEAYPDRIPLAPAST